MYEGLLLVPPPLFVFQSVRTDSLAAENPDCHGVNFYDDGQPGGCVHASEWEFEPKGGPLAGQTVVAIPVNKRP